MKIMVFDVPASSGGAMSILESHYNQAITDNENEYIFVISSPILQGHQNIKILRFPWIKTSRFHRLYFDLIIANKLVKKYKPDKIFSLQNLTIFRAKISQEIYIHNVIPFSDYKFKLTKNPNLWFYQNIYKFLLVNSLFKANKVYVQTVWLKEYFLRNYNFSMSKIIVSRPIFNRTNPETYNGNNSSFLYPASAEIFKNHEIIIEASRILVKNGHKNFKVFFTIFGNENSHIRKLTKIIEANNLPISFVGILENKVLQNYYINSVLIFPSRIESFGLPLLEAKEFKCPIITINQEYARELLSDYKDKYFFEKNDAKKLSELMRKFI